MDQPKIADRKPKQVNLDAGEHHWCACGVSNNQPFCDGSHAGSGLTPKAFSVEEPSEAYLCMCKHTGNPPYCDGTHASLPDEQEETQSTPPPMAVDGMPSPRNTSEEPTVELIHSLASDGLVRLAA